MFVSKLLSLKLQSCEKYIKRCRQQVGCRKEHWSICITSIAPGCLPLSWEQVFLTKINSPQQNYGFFQKLVPSPEQVGITQSISPAH